MEQCESLDQKPSNDRDRFEHLLDTLVDMATEQATDLACHVQEGGKPYKLDDWAYTTMQLDRAWQALKASYGSGAASESDRKSYHRGQIEMINQLCTVINDLLNGKFEKRYGLLEPWASTHDRLVARLSGATTSHTADEDWVLVSERLPELGENAVPRFEDVKCLVNLENGEVFEARYTRNQYAKTEKGRLPRWERNGRILTSPVYAWKKMPSGPRRREHTREQD